MRLKNLKLTVLISAVFFVSMAFSSGALWVDKPISTTSILFDVSAFDHNNIFAVGENGLVYKTSNNGSSWQTIATGTTDAFTKVKSYGENDAFVLSGNLPFNMAVGSRLLYKSNSGVFSINKDYSSVFDEIYSMTSSGETLLLVGEGPTYNYAKSTDLGNTWTEKTINASSIIINDSFIVDENTEWLLLPITSLLALSVFHTTNAGSVWEQSTLYFSEANTRSSCFGYGQNYLWIVGIFGRLIKTSDGGKTWSDYNINYGQSYLYEAAFINEKVGWAVSGIKDLPSSFSVNSGVYRTLDGGETWEIVKRGHFFGMDMLANPTKVMAVGSGGAFSILEPPSISAISKKEFKQATSEVISITGAGFEKATVEGVEVFPSFSFNKSGITAETVSLVSSNEIQVRVYVSREADIGPVDMTLFNIDTTSTIETSALIVGSGEAGMSLSFLVPADGQKGERLDVAINGENIPNPGALGTVEALFSGSGINILSIAWRNENQVALNLTIESTAVAGPRNLTLTIKDSSGEVVASYTKNNVFEVQNVPDPGTMPDPKTVLPILDNGIWKQETGKAPDAPLPDLPVQIKAPESGSYNIMVATPAGVKYKDVKNLNVGYNKIVIPGNREWTNGVHTLLIEKGGKVSRARIVVNR